jgi:ferredoxin-NADP reductase
MLIHSDSSEIAFQGDLKIQNKDIEKYHKVVAIRHLTKDAFIISFERKNKMFKAGQHIRIKLPQYPSFRVYTIYSGSNNASFEVLVKEVESGMLTPKLKHLKINDYVHIEGPSGNFCLDPEDINNSKYLFLATGTGISPFHSFTQTFPNLNYHIIHGVRLIEDAYEKVHYPEDKIIICTTGDSSGDYQGRLTEYLQDSKLELDQKVYLCGSSAMINDAVEVLKKKGFQLGQIYIESYY